MLGSAAPSPSWQLFLRHNQRRCLYAPRSSNHRSSSTSDEPPNSSTGTPPLNSQHLSDHSSHGVRDSIAAAELQEASIPGQARSAILSAQLARIRQDRTDAVTGAAHAMVILQSKITQLRGAGIKSAVREMALRHQCAELQQSNEAWMRESSQARASSISGAFDSLDADALAAGIFKAETQGIFSCERGVDGLLRDIKLARVGKSKFR